MLRLLIQRPGEPLSKSQILDRLVGEDSDIGPEAVEVMVYRLRRKLEGSGVAIVTLRGLGYLLEPEHVSLSPDMTGTRSLRRTVAMSLLPVGLFVFASSLRTTQVNIAALAHSAYDRSLAAALRVIEGNISTANGGLGVDLPYVLFAMRGIAIAPMRSRSRAPRYQLMPTHPSVAGPIRTG